VHRHGIVVEHCGVGVEHHVSRLQYGHAAIVPNHHVPELPDRGRQLGESADADAGPRGGRRRVLLLPDVTRLRGAV
jgi:hypothetical protein